MFRKHCIFVVSQVENMTQGNMFQSAFFPARDLLLVFRILNGLVSPFPALVLAPEFWLVLFPFSVFVLAQQ